MEYVKDGSKYWPCTIDSVGDDKIIVMMAGRNGYNAVNTGPIRNGAVVMSKGIEYNVALPGAFGLNPLLDNDVVLKLK